jgi:nicotinamidase-related amidase
MPDYTLPDRQHVALITNDLQRDFVDSTSPLACRAPTRCVGQSPKVVTAFRQAGLPIFHAVRFFLPDGSNVECSRRQAVEEGMRVLMPGTQGAELIAGVSPNAQFRLNAPRLLEGEVQEIGTQEAVFYKKRWGAFYDSKLDGLLRQRNISTVVVIGSDFECGLRATVYEACARDYRVVVVPDAAGCPADNKALDELGRLGVYLINADALTLWVSTPRPAQGAA